MTWMKNGCVASLCLAALLLAGCGDGSNDASADNNPSADARPAWLLSDAPGQATAVGEAKTSVQAGDEVKIVGRIGGRLKPMEPGSPVFLIVDPSVPSCAELHEDACPTPWDYCCEPPNSLMANSATVQLLDASGAPSAVDPIAAGLSPLDEVVVVGKVGPRPSDQVLTIQATGVYVQQPAEQLQPRAEPTPMPDQG